MKRDMATPDHSKFYVGCRIVKYWQGCGETEILHTLGGKVQCCITDRNSMAIPQKIKTIIESNNTTWYLSRNLKSES